ncbi:MAG: PilW family protein [Gammaproteobacteria bacterium]|nr:PilW family protein [Gammaproteobacteria bacterium]
MNSARNFTARRESGLTLVELMVALAIGSFLIIGAVQIYSQSREAFIVNESIARVQETAQFAMDTIEADLRMASNWGRNSRGLAVEGRAIPGNNNPLDLTLPSISCGDTWVLDLALPIDGNNNGYGLDCGAKFSAQTNSDVVTIRRASVQPAAPQAGRLQIQSTRLQGQLFDDDVVPSAFTPAESATHNLMVHSYYVAQSSTLLPGVPTLFRKTLTMMSGEPVVQDQEVAHGVENIQLQLGIDVNQDNAVDRYVNAGDPIYDPTATDYAPGARVIAARLWLVVRGITPEFGLQDASTYQPGDVTLTGLEPNYRRMQVSKTILLRNART